MDLRRSFGKFHAVDGLDLNVREGEIYGFLGVNGAGKTTAIRTIMGITKPSGGRIELFNKKVRKTTIKQKQRIGYVSQEQFLYPWMTAKLLGKFVSGLYPKWDQTEYERLLEVFSVPYQRKVSALSGGMKMKLALALALAPRPDLLILDEPTAGMDPVARHEFLEIIKLQARRDGRTTFFSTHLLDEVEKTADRVGIIHEGKMRYEGELSDLQTRVQRVILPIAEAQLWEPPPSFDLWREEYAPENRSIILEADPERWPELEIPPGSNVEHLSLDEIFIACAGADLTAF